MGKGISYCSVCGERILEREFEKGKAVTLLKKDYCKKCAKGVVKEAAKKEAPTAQPGTVAPPPRKQRTQRIPLADKRDFLPKKPALPMPYIIAILIGVAALILLIVVLSRGGSAQ